MYVSNGSGFAVPVFTRKTSTNVTSQRRIGDEQGVARIQDHSAPDDLYDDGGLCALHRVGAISARPIDTAGQPD